MQTHRRSALPNGFTLVEVQISLLLLVLIMGLLFGALFIASKQWRSGQIQTDQIEDMRLVAEFLRRQVTQIKPLNWTNNRGAQLIFKGESDSIQYIGKLPAKRYQGALMLMQLGLSSTQPYDGQQLELGYSLLDANSDPFKQLQQGLKTTPVLDQVKTLKFEYFGQQKLNSKELKWSHQWQSKHLLPRLIKVQITLKDGQQWPEMLLPLPITNVSGFRQFRLQASQASSSTTAATQSELGIGEIF